MGGATPGVSDPSTDSRSRLEASFHAQLTTGGTSRLGIETQQLLRVRLKAAGALLFTVLLLSFLRSLMLTETPPLRGVHLLLLGFLAAVTMFLRSRAEISLQSLRIFDLLMIISVACFLAVSHYKSFSLGVAQGALDKVSNQLEHSLLAFVFLILVYGVFIPNTWKRASLLVIPVALTPILMRVVLAVENPVFRPSM